MIVDTTYNVDALIALGANYVAEIRDEAGVLAGYEVRPDIDLNGYAAAEDARNKAALAAYAAARRYAVETGGITVNGQPIKTDRESQALITGAYNLSLAVPDTTIQFKTETSFVALSADDVKAIAIAVGQHVQAAFAKEAEVAAAINAGTITDTAGVDAAFAAVQ